jgi:hypothetical protein
VPWSTFRAERTTAFSSPSGRALSSGFLLDATYEILLTYRTAVKDFCLIQETPNRVNLEIVAGAGWNAEVSTAIETRFATFFEPGVHFAISVVDVCSKTKSGKRNPIISRVTKK